MREFRVVYQDGPEIRCLRGLRVDDTSDPLFVIIYRMDGTVHKIAKRLIEKIVEEGVSNGH